MVWRQCLFIGDIEILQLETATPEKPDAENDTVTPENKV